ncbi:hypothetical protein HAX54_012823 [Datura stramonium]|uniref:Uncharacterized protein n=1 Tax=Datura stramonium TaxID=4076 RepID=A0ABS8TKE5_DATST|nr:hypothetical protein [Datura stramonium]
MDKNIIVTIFVVLLCVTTATAIRQVVITATNHDDGGIQEASKINCRVTCSTHDDDEIQQAFKRIKDRQSSGDTYYDGGIQEASKMIKDRQSSVNAHDDSGIQDASKIIKKIIKVV